MDLNDAGSRAKFLIRDRSWIQTCRTELLDRTLIWNQSHLLHALREYESFYNEHRPHRVPEQATPCPRYPHPPPDKPSSPTWNSADETDLAEPSTSTSERPELCG
ncbi:transposase [Streptomyces coffeae]|uniref:transposase n=1 Tax=Streptomyces coffeae TaxID=621382 RepID=UPI001F2A9DD7|nr:transposase [Streptomyces coffeae]